MNWTKEEVEEAISKVVDKASTDAEFRTLVLSDVHAAVKEVTGKEVAEGIKINVVDSTGYHVNIVLPEIQAVDDELTETELETVAGGVNGMPKPSPGPIYIPNDRIPRPRF